MDASKLDLLQSCHQCRFLPPTVTSKKVEPYVPSLIPNPREPKKKLPPKWNLGKLMLVLPSIHREEMNKKITQGYTGMTIREGLRLAGIPWDECYWTTAVKCPVSDSKVYRQCGLMCREHWMVPEMVDYMPDSIMVFGEKAWSVVVNFNVNTNVPYANGLVIKARSSHDPVGSKPRIIGSCFHPRYFLHRQANTNEFFECMAKTITSMHTARQKSGQAK